MAGRLDVSEDSVEAIRDALGREVAPGVVLYAKTGSGRIEGREESGFLGWQVGWVERDNTITVFAFWTEAKSYTAMREKRSAFLADFTKRLSQESGRMDAPFTAP